MWRNFTRTTAEESQRIFINEMDNAYRNVVSGAVSYTEAVKDVLNKVTENDNGMWGDGGWFWIIILAFLFCGNGWGNNNGAQNAFVSDEFVKRDIFNTKDKERTAITSA